MQNLGMHFHDTYGQALANLYAGLEEGARVIGSAAGGLGGCPYAPGATGNVATEDVVYMLEGMGVQTGVDMKQLVAATNDIAKFLGKSPGEPRCVRAQRQGARLEPGRRQCRPSMLRLTDERSGSGSSPDRSAQLAEQFAMPNAWQPTRSQLSLAASVATRTPHRLATCLFACSCNFHGSHNARGLADRTHRRNLSRC